MEWTWELNEALLVKCLPQLLAQGKNSHCWPLALRGRQNQIWAVKHLNPHPVSAMKWAGYQELLCCFGDPKEVDWGPSLQHHQASRRPHPSAQLSMLLDSCHQALP